MCKNLITRNAHIEENREVVGKSRKGKLGHKTHPGRMKDPGREDQHGSVPFAKLIKHQKQLGREEGLFALQLTIYHQGK